MPITRKRKSAAVDNQNADQPTGMTQQGIKAFSTVSKPQDGQNIVNKKRKTQQLEATPPPTDTMEPPQRRASVLSKRKRNLDPVNDENADPEQPRIKISPTKRARKSIVPESPTTGRAFAAFDRLNLNSLPSQDEKSGYQTPPYTPETEKNTGELPFELQELIQLHAAFLASLSVYYAHNGTSSPAEVEAILSMATKNWKRRGVSLKDLRRMLAVDERQVEEFTLQDYGRGGICLTRSQPRGRAINRAASYIDEQELSKRFEERLRQRWAQSQCSADDVAAFMDSLPLIEIVRNAAVEKAAPMFARGQQRLADLKAGQAAAHQSAASSSVVTVSNETRSTHAVQSRGTSLLDRILSKQAHTKGMPAGPTREHLERKAALHRVEDVARVLELLAGTKMRASFSFQILTQHLQQSLRNPISREEVDRCVDLMAKEITPGFVNVIQSGSVKGIVVVRSQKIALEDLRARVQRADA